MDNYSDIGDITQLLSDPLAQISLMLWIRGQAEMNAEGQGVLVYSPACSSPILINSQVVIESGSSLPLPGFRMSNGRPASQAPGQDSNLYIYIYIYLHIYLYPYIYIYSGQFSSVQSLSHV